MQHRLAHVNAEHLLRNSVQLCLRPHEMNRPMNVADRLTFIEYAKLLSTAVCPDAATRGEARAPAVAALQKNEI